MDDNNVFIAMVFALALAFVAARAWAHGDHQHESARATPPAVQARPLRLGETVLVDQDGRKLHLASEAVADKVVVATFVYTQCADTCPMVSHTFSEVQRALGPLMERQVRLLSLTVDPAHDTPARLKSYAANFDAGPGWLWLTGEAPAVTEALKAFGVHVSRPENHPVVVVVGDPRTGRWLRLHDIDSPRLLVDKVAELLAARSQAPQGHSLDSSLSKEPS